MDVRGTVIQSSRSDFIHSSFKGAGFLIEENRPLKVCSFILFSSYLVVKDHHSH